MTAQIGMFDDSAPSKIFGVFGYKELQAVQIRQVKEYGPDGRPKYHWLDGLVVGILVNGTIAVQIKGEMRVTRLVSDPEHIRNIER